jgi:hypothetical protein
MTDEEKPKGIASYVERLKSLPGPAGDRARMAASGLTVGAAANQQRQPQQQSSAAPGYAALAAQGLTVSPGGTGARTPGAGALAAAGGLTVNPLNVAKTSQPGISKVTGTGLSSPLYTNEGGAGRTSGGLSQQAAGSGATTANAAKANPLSGPAAGLTITPFGGVNAANQQTPQNEGLSRMAAANATRQSMIDAQPRGGPEAGITIPFGSANAAPQNEGLSRMAAANATRQSMIDAQPRGGPEAGITIPFGSANAAPQNEGLSRMAAANATRQSMIDAQPRGGPEAGITIPFGSANAAPQNEGMARVAAANAITKEMIDALPRGGSAVMADPADRDNDTLGKMRRNQQVSELTEAVRRGYGAPGAAASALNAMLGAESQKDTENIRQRGVMAGVSTQRRGQDLGYGAQMAQMGLTARGQDMQAATVREQIGGQERVAEIQANAAKRLTLPQVRENQEIEAARQRLAGMSADEIKRRTANYTETGRENPDFDPTLARAQTLAGRRMYGDDRDFDARQQPQPADDAPARFKADKAMAGHTLGKQTELGTEVFDASGRLIGHYR